MVTEWSKLRVVVNAADNTMYLDIQDATYTTTTGGPIISNAYNSQVTAT